MAGKYGTVNTIANDDNATKTNMMDVWRESIQRGEKNRQSPTNVAESQREATAELEQKIRSGQVQCPTCASRTYRDESDDGGVSFQAPKSLSGATAGVTVMSHEAEHVSANKSESSPEKDGVVRSSTVTLEYDTCPDCGRRYVAGGVTKTTSQPASYANFSKTGGFDTKV